MKRRLRPHDLRARVLAAFVVSALVPTLAQARVEIAWGDANGFTIDGISAHDFGESSLLAQLILAGPGGGAAVDPNDPDGLSGGDVLLASLDVPIDAQNPNGAFLLNLASAIGSPLPGETIYLRVFAGGLVATGVRYAQTVPVLVEDITVDRPQAISFTGAPPASGYGTAPRELDLTVMNPTSGPPLVGTVWMAEARPNPFNPTTTLTLHVPTGGAQIQVDVFDTRGRLVRTLASGWFEGPEQTIRWRGGDSSGQPLASGVYRVRMRSGGHTQERSVVLVR